MEVKEKKTFNDFIIKVKRVFSHDIYIVNRKWILGGAESNLALPADFSLEIDPNFQPYVDMVFFDGHPERKDIYVGNLSSVKKDTTSYEELIIRDVTEQEQEEFVKARMQQVYEILGSDDIWNPFLFSKDVEQHDQAVMDCFDVLKLVKLPDPKEQIHDVILGKSMLPGIGKKDIDNVFFRIELFDSDNETGSVFRLIIRYEFTHYCMYGVYYFV